MHACFGLAVDHVAADYHGAGWGVVLGEAQSAVFPANNVFLLLGCQPSTL